jgi:hypothetical protein
MELGRPGLVLVPGQGPPLTRPVRFEFRVLTRRVTIFRLGFPFLLVIGLSFSQTRDRFTNADAERPG